MTSKPPTTFTGWLIKEGGSWKSWKKRYFVLDREKKRLSYFKKETDKVAVGAIDLDTCSHIMSVDYKKKENVFQIQTPSRMWHMIADTPAERDEWVSQLNKTLESMHPTAPEPKVTAADFELLKLVGKGSFGKVMQVRYKKTGEIFAMKVLSKAHIVEHNEVEHTLAELHILQKLHHPFLVNLHYSFQTNEQLYFVLDFVNGGELFFHLQHEKRFSVERARFYGAEICLALEHLHNAGVVYRDLKPENLLLTVDGHICMTDFGLCKEGLKNPTDKTGTFCGTPEYLAPEILLGNGYGKAVDWWSYGSLLYEMIVGLPPFYSADVQEMYQKIISEPLTFPPYVPPDAQDLLVRLLERDPEQRLADPNVIKRHPFYQSIDWDLLFHKGITPPYIPPVADSTDTTQIDPTFLQEKPTYEVDEGAAAVTAQDQQDFANFTFVAGKGDAEGEPAPPPLPPG